MSAKSVKKPIRLSENMALQASEDKFKFMFERSSGAKSFTLPSGEINVNPAFGEMLGYSREELSRKSWQEITYPEDIEPSQKAIEKLLSGQQDSVQFEKRYLHQSGAVVWAEVSTALLRNSGGEPLYFMTEINDITKRKQAEANLERTRDFLLESQAIAHFGSWEYIVATQETLWSEEQLRIYGLNPAGKSPDYQTMLRKHIHPDDAVRLDEIFRQCLQSHTVYEQEHRIVHRDGSVRVLQEIARPYFDENGKLIRYLGVALDITERKRTEEALRLRESYLTAILENQPGLVWLKDVEGRFLTVNQAFADTCGQASPAELTGKTDFDIWPKELAEKYRADDASVLQNQAPQVVEEPIFDGIQTSWFETFKTPILDGQEVVIGTTGFSRNITERKLAEEALKQSEEKFRLSFMTSQDAFYWSTLEEGRLLEINPGFETVWGYSRAEVLGRTSLELGLYANPADRARLVAELKAKGFVKDMELEGQKKDGTLITISISASPMLFNRQNYILGVMRDITERKRTEQKLAENERNYRNLVQNLQIGLVVHAPDTSVLFSNLKASQLLGLTPDQMRGKAAIDPAWHFIQEDGARMPLDQYPVNQALTAEIPITNLILGILRPDREGPTWVQCNAHQDLDLDGKIQQVVVTFADITQRKLAEERLFQSHELLASLARLVPGVIYQYRLYPDGRSAFPYASPGMNDIYEVTPEDVQEDASPVFGRLHPDDYDHVANAIQESANTLNEFYCEFRVVLPRQGLRWRSSQAHPERTTDGGTLWHGIISDITERKQAEKEMALRLSFEMLLAKIQADFLAVTADEVDQAILSAQRKLCELFGTDRSALWQGSADEPEKLLLTHICALDEIPPVPENVTTNTLFPWFTRQLLANQIVAISDLELLPPEAATDFENLTYYGDKSTLAIPFSFGDLPVYGALSFAATAQPARWSAATLAHCGLVAQVFSGVLARKQIEDEVRKLNVELEARVEERTRELRDTQEQLVQQERLAVLGRLAGGLAHELRNPLGIINNAIYYLRIIQQQAEENVREYLGIIETETHNANKIVSALLNFSSDKRADVEPVAVSSLVNQVLGRFPAPEGVRVKLEIPENLPNMYADPQHTAQVLGNLLVNAYQAMPEGGELFISSRVEGLVTNKQSSVRTESLNTDPSTALTRTSAGSTSNWVLITVRDSGLGIPHENMQKLFEPLFTTKAKGIGLGLAVSKKLIETNGGKIIAESEPGKGSIFTVYLPMQDEVQPE